MWVPVIVTIFLWTADGPEPKGAVYTPDTHERYETAWACELWATWHLLKQRPELREGHVLVAGCKQEEWV